MNSTQVKALLDAADEMEKNGFPVSAAICKSSAKRMGSMEELIVSLKDNVEAKEFIPRELLLIGMPYELQSRNIRVGIWDGHEFHGIREKFGSKFIDSEIHHDLDERHGTAKATRILS